MSTVNVTDFGVTGTGDTNDGPAIESAILKAGIGGTVLFPPGTYDFNHINVFVPGVTLLGSGPRATSFRLRFGGSVPLGYGEAVGIRADDVTIKGIAVINTENLDFENGIGIVGSRAIVEDCWVDGFKSTGDWVGNAGGGKGIHIDQHGSHCRVANNTVRGCRWGLSNIGDYTTNDTHGQTFFQNIVEGCDVGAIFLAFSDTQDDHVPPVPLSYKMQNRLLDNLFTNCRFGVVIHRVAACVVQGNLIGNTFDKTKMTHPTTGNVTNEIVAFNMSGCHDNLISHNSVHGLYSSYINFSPFYNVSDPKHAAYNAFFANLFLGAAEYGVDGRPPANRPQDENNYSNKFIFNSIRGVTKMRYSHVDGRNGAIVEADLPNSLESDGFVSFRQGDELPGLSVYSKGIQVREPVVVVK